MLFHPPGRAAGRTRRAPPLAAQLRQLPRPAPAKSRHRIRARPPDGAGASPAATRQRGRAQNRARSPGAGACSRQLQRKPGAGVRGLTRWPASPTASSWPLPHLPCWPHFCWRCYQHGERLQFSSLVMTQVGEVPKQEVNQVWAQLQQNWAQGPGGSSA